MATVREMIDSIRCAQNWTEERLAAELGVTQPSVNRWQNEGTLPSEKHLSALMDLYLKAKWLLVNASLEASGFEYVCSFAPTYTDKLSTAAMEALNSTLHTLHDRRSCPAPTGACVDFHVRAVRLSHGARAHTFEDGRAQSPVFVVLVNADLTDHEQFRVAWDEAFAHVMTRLIDRSRSVQHPKSLLR